MKECIIILGMHRSGTSVLTGLVSLFGGYVGADLMKPTKDNPKGYFENNKIYRLNEKILRESGSSWHDFMFSIEDIDQVRFQGYVEEAKSVIEHELKYVKKCIIKDPRISVLFPIWEQALNELDINIKVILSYRSPLEVALSLNKRDDMSVEKGLMLWSNYFFASEKYSRKYNRLIVEYDGDFIDLKGFLDRVGTFIGVEVNKDIVKKAEVFYSPTLKHHNVSLNNTSDDLPKYLVDIITLLIDQKLSQKKKIDKIRSEYIYSRKYFLHDFRQKEKLLLDNEEALLNNATQLESQEHELLNKQKELEKSNNEIIELQQQLDEYTLKARKTNKELQRVKHSLSDAANELVVSSGEVERLTFLLKKGENDYLSTIQKKDGDYQHVIKKKEIIIEEKENSIRELMLLYKSGGNLFNKILDSNKFHKRLKKYSSNSPNTVFNKFNTLLSKRKGRKIARESEIIKASGLFSHFFYLTINPDVRRAGVNPIVHYCQNGWKEGRSPSMVFDTNAYLRQHPDVARANVNPLLHYINNGIKEGRKVSPVVLRGKKAITPLNVGKRKDKVLNSSKSKAAAVGPIFNDYHENTVSSVALLQKRKLSNKKIPQNVIELTKDILRVSPLKISVVMPTWNRRNSIGKAIESILEQSYQPFEIIVSDDGSTDGTIEYLKQTYKKEISDKLIIILPNKHMGVSATRNSALTEARGDLVAYLDSDNIWRKHYLLIMAAAFAESDEVNCAYSALERHDKNSDSTNTFLAVKYDRKRLLDGNFIDLNVFVHRRVLFDQFGGFDTKLKRLVDWELVIRYTKNYEPAFIPFVGVDYFLDDKNLKNITTTVSLDDNRERVYQSHFRERLRYGLENLRLAYVLWDFPALSQTFVIEELKWLVQEGHDVIVYFSVEPDKSAILDFEIESFQVESADDLAGLLEEHHRNFCHSHFAYPTVTRLTYPACLKRNIPFTFMPHAVDIFHHENRKRNMIGEITQHPLCVKVLVHGEFHKKFIEDCGVPSNKIAFNIQAVNISDFTKKMQVLPRVLENIPLLRGVVITRFVEKKGINTLLEAAALLKDDGVVFDIYGYGPLEDDYKKQIKELALDNVILKGALTNQQAVSKAYEESDFLIVPCVVAENGDMDGFPTVILEAMAMGLPVITTDIAAIPDYLTDGVEAIVAPAGNIEQIAESVRRLKAMSVERKVAMIKRSQDFLKKKIGVRKTMQMLLDTWLDYTLDIFLVTFNTEKYEDRKETFEIINRIFKFTTTPFTLTIIDNDSDDDFWDEICSYVKGYPNVRLIQKSHNNYCGPASNIALELSQSEYAIYICSKEGFIKKHGWERTLLEHMRNNPDHVMAGHYSQMPKYIYGKEYETHPDFANFRNPEFAKKNPDRVFKHVQGGVYIIQREFVKEHGGFNPETPHGGMDIEMSYYIESIGYQLGEIPEVASLTTKTRPTLTAITNERTVIAHPLTIESVTNDLDSLIKEAGHRCNICGWQGQSFIIETIEKHSIHKCPDCHSTGFARSVMKILANDQHIYRNEVCVVLSCDKALQAMLNKLFRLVLIHTNEDTFQKSREENVDLYIIDPELLNNNNEIGNWEKMLSHLAASGEILFADHLFEDESILSNAMMSTNKTLTNALSKFDGHYLLKYSDYSSYCIAYDWRRFGRIMLSLSGD